VVGDYVAQRVVRLRREKAKPGYDPKKVARNNALRIVITEQKREKGAERFARRRGFPSYQEMEESSFDEDGGWDDHNCTLAICNICDLRVDYCRCGDGCDGY